MVSGAAWSSRMTPGDLQWRGCCFSQQGSLISVESALSAMALLTHVQLVTHHSSRSFSASLLHKSKPLFYISLQWITSIYFQRLWCIYSPAQLHIIHKLNKDTPSCIIQVITKTEVQNWTGARTDLFLVVLSTLPHTFLKHKPPISNLSLLSWPLSSQVCIQHTSNTLMSISVKIASLLSPKNISLLQNKFDIYLSNYQQGTVTAVGISAGY